MLRFSAGLNCGDAKLQSLDVWLVAREVAGLARKLPPPANRFPPNCCKLSLDPEALPPNGCPLPLNAGGFSPKCGQVQAFSSKCRRPAWSCRQGDDTCTGSK